MAKENLFLNPVLQMEIPLDKLLSVFIGESPMYAQVIF